MSSAYAIEARRQLVGLFGIVERNVYLTKRYILWDLAFMVWTIANTLTIVFIARGVGLSPAKVNIAETSLLVGATIWAFLGIIFEFMTEIVAWERWEGTIEYTFMAPLSRLAHLFGQGAFAVLYGLIRASILFFAVAAFIGLHMPGANFGAAFLLLALASLSFIGVGIMTSVLPLISPEKGAQLGFVGAGSDARGLGRLLQGHRHAGVDAVDLEDLAGDVRAARRPGVDHRRRRDRVGGRLAASDHRRPRDTDRLGDLQPRRAVREEARETQEGRVMQDWFAGRVAERYDANTADMPLEPVLNFLEPLAGGGALELAIGTGRIAVPLAARGVRVAGIDLSPDMVAELREKTDAIPVSVGDMTTTRVEGTFSLAYIVFNSINNVTTQDGQAAAFANAAAHLEPGGRFVVEVEVPGKQRLEVFDLSDTHVGVDELDFDTQRLVSHHFSLRDGEWHRLSIPFRAVSPAELDLMARLAGMKLRERWADWDRAPFTAESEKHVSVWEK